MLAIEVDLREGRYDADAPGWREPEWPPEPARVFMALVAAVSDEDEREVLRWLEEQAPPIVLASPPEDTKPTRDERFVVTNRLASNGGNLTFPGRTNGERARTGVTVKQPRFAVVWPTSDPPPGAVDILDRVAARVPYVGRVTSRAHVRAVAELDHTDGWAIYEPQTIGSPGRHLRVLHAGYLDELIDAHAQGRRPHDLAGVVPYAAPADDVESGPVHGPFGDLLVFGFVDAAPIGGDRFLHVAGMLRRAVLARIGDGIPPAVSGHGADGRPHVAYLALPTVGHRYSDGHLLGVAVALPRALEPADRRPLAAALVGRDPMELLTIDRSTEVAVRYEPDRVAPYGLRPDFWTGRPDTGARRWRTATPLMLDRYPKPSRPVELVIADALERDGYPRPETVVVTPEPLLPGGVRRPRRGTVPAGRPRRPFVHVEVQFPTPVVGPVLSGALRYLGSGLFAPVAESAP